MQNAFCITFDLQLATIYHYDLCFVFFLSGRLRQVLLHAVNPRNFELRLFELLANSKWISGTMNLGKMAYLWSILITANKNIWFAKIIVLNAEH